VCPGREPDLAERIPGAVNLDDAVREKLAELAKRRVRTLLKEITNLASPDTILGWYTSAEC
jgi:hypothetical protein